MIAGSYAATWQRHRRRSWAFWLLLLGFVPGAPLLAVWLGRLVHSESLLLPTTLGWMAAVAIAGACRSSLRCPRCGERFFRKGRQYRNEFARKCVNCGFPKWALADETSRAAVTLLLLVLSLPVAASSSDPQPAITHVYREIGGESLHAHVFLPPGHRTSDRAHAILLFHGGGWSAGAPKWTFSTARRFADAGLVAIAVQYRLSNGDVTPIDALSDACAAFEWTRRHADELGLSGRIAGYGVSAGGHLVAATATIGCPDHGAGPEALLLWSPALDVVNDRWFNRKLQGRGNAADLSPSRHVGRSTPPTSIVHGERDTLTPPAGVRRYCAALSKLGRICEIHLYPGLGHLLTRNLANQESDYDPDPQARADGIARQQEFLRRLGFIKEAEMR